MGRKENANFCGVALRKSSLFCPHDENENKLWKILTSNDKGFQELSGQDEVLERERRYKIYQNDQLFKFDHLFNKWTKSMIPLFLV